MMEATPRPWPMPGPDDTNENGDWYITLPSGGYVAIVVTDPMNMQPARANADLIVRAVNAHDALVTELNRWVDPVVGDWLVESDLSGACIACVAPVGIRQGEPWSCDHEDDCAVLAGQAALALARGEAGGQG